MALIDLFLARRVKRGTLTVHHADGKTVRFGTADPRVPDVTIRFTDAGAAAAIAMHTWVRQHADLGAEETWRG